MRKPADASPTLRLASETPPADAAPRSSRSATRKSSTPTATLRAPLPAFAADAASADVAVREMLALRLFDAQSRRAAAHRAGSAPMPRASAKKPTASASGARWRARTCCSAPIARPARCSRAACAWPRSSSTGAATSAASAYAGPHAPQRGLSDLRADRDACAASGRRRLRVQAAARAARGRLRPRRRRHLERRLLRGAEWRRRVATAARVRRREQRVGDLGAAQRANARANVGAKSHRGGYPRRASRRQRRPRRPRRHGESARQSA